MRFLVLWLLLTAASLAQTRWQPENTYVLVASITSWPPAAGLAPFVGTRRDGDLVKQLNAAGVPEDNIIFLKDKQATRQGIRQALVYLAGKTTPKDTLIFYFQGHGGRQRLYCYDYNKKEPEQSVLGMNELYPLLEKPFKGGRLLMIGDCCCSGSLDSVVQQFEKGRPQLPVAAIASATATNLSTGNWTFTEALLRVLAGDPLVDGNGDGQLDMGEAERFVHNQMKYKEDQLASVTLTPAFERNFVWRATSGKAAARLAGPHQVGDLLEAQDFKGRWYTAEILEGKGERYKIHFNGWDSKWDEWVDASKLRPIVKTRLNVGQSYEVLWNKRWYPAILTRSIEDYFYFAHFENEAGEDDEWITPERARLPRQPGSGPEFKPPTDSSPPKPGDLVAAQWHKSWFRARITGMVNGTYSVHYDDDTTGQASLAELIPIGGEAVSVGDRVLACWGQDGRMFPGRVLQLEDGVAMIRWEDGSSSTRVSLDKLARIRH